MVAGHTSPPRVIGANGGQGLLVTVGKHCETFEYYQSARTGGPGSEGVKYVVCSHPNERPAISSSV